MSTKRKFEASEDSSEQAEPEPVHHSGLSEDQIGDEEEGHHVDVEEDAPHDEDEEHVYDVEEEFRDIEEDPNTPGDDVEDDVNEQTELMPEHVANLSDPFGYEYLDHTADVQLHAWGPDLKTALEQTVIAMFGYMTELSMVDIGEEHTTSIEVTAHDLPSLLFALLDEFLYQFSTENLVFKEVEIRKLDLEQFRIQAEGRGETFTLGKHPQGTEIKAITYSNMQIFTDLTVLNQINRGDDGEAGQVVHACTTPDRHEVYVIVDI